MSSRNETRRMQRKKNPAQKPDLSTQYRQIGIKAVAAATHDDAKGSGDASGAQKENERKKRRAKEKANG